MAHNLWRIIISANNGADQLGIAEIEMMSSIGGEPLQLYCSTYSDGERGLAYDHNNVTVWTGSYSFQPKTTTGYLVFSIFNYDTSPIDIVQYTITSSTNGAQAPMDWMIQYADGDPDATYYYDAVWTTAIEVSGQTGWGSNEKRTFLTAESSPFDRKERDAVEITDTTFVQGGEDVPPFYSWWRLRFTGSVGPNGVQIGDIEMRARYGGLNQCIGGTGYTSYQPGVAATWPFDGNPTTSGDLSIPCWFSYHFTRPVTVAEYVITPYYAAAYAPTDWVLESSSDGVGWSTRAWESDVNDWDGDSSRSFGGMWEQPYPDFGHEFWRLLVTDSNGGGALEISEIEFRGSVGGADQCVGGNSWSNFRRHDDLYPHGDTSASAFDNNAGTNWAPQAWGFPCYAQYNFAAAVDVVQYAVTFNHDGRTSRAPKSWVLQYSDTGGPDEWQWTSVSEVTGQIGWVSGETRLFLAADMQMETPALTDRAIALHVPASLSDTHSYWRVRPIVDVNGTPSVYTLDFRSSRGGSNIATGGTAIDSSHYSGYEPAKAFDGTSSTYWHGQGSQSWIGYHFAAPVAVIEYAFATTMTDFVLEFSDDGTTWYVSGEAVRDQGGGASFTMIYTTDPPAAKEHSYWRMKMTEMNIAAGYAALFDPPVVGLQQIVLQETVGGENLGLTVGGNCTDSINYGSNVADIFMGSHYTISGVYSATPLFGVYDGWGAQADSVWVQIHLATAKKVTAYTVKAPMLASTAWKPPKSWVIQHSDDGVNWTDAATETNQTDWAYEEVRSYVIEESPFDRTLTEALDLIEWWHPVGGVNPPGVIDVDDNLALTSQRITADMGKLAHDGFTVTTPTKGDIAKLIRDFVQFVERVPVRYIGSAGIADSMFLWDHASGAKIYLKTLSEVLTAGTLPPVSALARTLVLREFLSTLDIAPPNFHGSVAASDKMSLAESLSPVKGFLKTLFESMSAVDRALAPHFIYTVLLLETAYMTELTGQGRGFVLKEMMNGKDTAYTQWAGAAALMEALALNATSPAGIGKKLVDSIQMSDQSMYLFALACIAHEVITESSALTSSKKALANCKCTLTISPSIVTKGEFKSIVQDHISLGFTINLNGDVYQCWSFSGDSMFPSLFTNYQFNAYAALPDGRVFATKDEGIYLLNGPDDAGAKIETGVRLNYFNMGTHHQKRLHYAYFGLIGEEAALRVITKEGENDYYVISGMARLAKGIKSHTWELVLTDIDALDFVEITPIILTR